MKKIIIISALLLGLALLLALWAFDKLTVFLGKENGFRFFNPRPHALNPLLGVASAGRSM